MAARNRASRSSTFDPNAIKPRKLSFVPLEQRLLAAARLTAQVFVSQGRGHATTRSPVQEAGLDQEGLIDLLDGIDFLAQRGGDGVHAHRPASVLVNDR